MCLDHRDSPPLVRRETLRRRSRSLPFTAFHPVFVWLLWKRFPRRFDFVALTVGAVIPDLFEPFVLLGVLDTEWLHRDWTHSLFGAVTLDALLALGATLFLARPMLAWADRRWPSGLWSRFAGIEFRTRASWAVLLVSVWVGTLSHVLLDVPFHATLRLFFPVSTVLLFHWELDLVATVIANLLFGPPFVYILYVHWWRPSRVPPEKRRGASRTD